MKTVLYMHNGSGNHGCEALVRTTARMVKKYVGGTVGLWSFTKSEEYRYGTDQVLDFIITSEEIKRFSPTYFRALFLRKILKRKNANYDVFLKKLFKNSTAVAIGGDNYCYPWSARQGAEIDAQIRPYCRHSILWGCSIGEEDLTDEIKKDLAGYDLITVREPLTYETLKKINRNVVKVADPAFTLEKKCLPLPDGFIDGNTVGINISPLIMKYEKEGNLAYDNYVELINFILNTTDMHVCLIPHVVWEYNNDLEPIERLFEQFRHTGRVIKIGDHDCRELKGFISRCRFFVGARTHATIAAYSTLVPTLVLGYSVKSKGIAMDLFGEYERYVLSVQDLKEPGQLASDFKFIMENEKQIKEQLQKVMPAYIQSAEDAGLALKKFIR